jgi:methionyl-tRNA formyltransferase
MKPRIVFMGSPDFAVPSLQALEKDFSVVGVVTQPDRPSGRGRKLTPPPIKILALDLGIPIIQPKKLARDEVAKIQLRAWKPDVIVVAAFGQILKRDVLEIAPFGCINVHASLLPRWRGVSPIQSAILHGDKGTGVTIMKMDEGIDTGDIISNIHIPIEGDETGGTLFNKLAKVGGELLTQTLPSYLNGSIVPLPQRDSPTPYAPMLKKSDGEVDFTKSIDILDRQVRAYHPWPGTYTYWNGKPLKIHKSHPISQPSPGVGTFTTYEGFPAIGASDGLLVIEQLQPAGKKSIPGDVFLRGAKNWISS